MKTSTKIMIAIGLVVVCSLYFFMKSRFNKVDSLESSSGVAVERREGSVVQNQGAPSRTLSDEGFASNAVVVNGNVSQVARSVSRDQREKLTEYRGIQRKVFLTDDEILRRKRLLADHSFLRSLAAVLKISASDQETQIDQNSAIDLLLEAVVKGPKETATEALREVIQDAQIEDRSLSVDQRQGIAEVKAEVMYQWTAIDPSKITEVESLLPGPISKKIWANVREMQTRNLAESSELGR